MCVCVGLCHHRYEDAEKVKKTNMMKMAAIMTMTAKRMKCFLERSVATDNDDDVAFDFGDLPFASTSALPKRSII